MNKALKDNLLSQIESVAGTLRRNFSHGGDELGLTKAEKFTLFLIATLNDCKPVISSEIAKKLGVTMAAVTHHINSLVVNRYVERTVSVDDHRVVFISITAKGLDIVNKYKEKRRQMVSDIIEYLGEEDTAKMISLIKKITDYLITKEGKEL